MSLEKVLHKLQVEVAGLIEHLENFTDTSVQPSVVECEELKHQIANVQEALNIYKHFKSGTELSPSFNIHSKISEVEPKLENIKSEVEIHEEPVFNNILLEDKTGIDSAKSIEEIDLSTENIFKVQKLSIAINDKFKYINELFLRNALEFNIAVEQINNLNNWADCENYLNSLRNLYNWKEQNETVKHLYLQVKKRFE